MWSSNPLELSLANDDLIESYKLFVQKMHTYDCKVIAQIKHGGSKAAYAASIGVPFLVPSLKEMSEQEMDDGKEMVSKLTQNELAEFVSNLKGAGNFKEMTKEDIDEALDQFQEAAKRAYKAGLDGVEIHAGHGYIISAFFYPQQPIREMTNMEVQKKIELNFWLKYFKQLDQ